MLRCVSCQSTSAFLQGALFQALLVPPPPPGQMVTKYKLGYDPVEVDPEDMVRPACTAVSHYVKLDAGCQMHLGAAVGMHRPAVHLARRPVLVLFNRLPGQGQPPGLHWWGRASS